MDPQVTPDAIMQLGFGYWGSRTLLSAVELSLFTELATGPLALEDIRARLHLHERGARDFLDALVALGTLKREQGRYANTPATFTWIGTRRPTWAACWR
jgi:hypothetical protein